jgi:hypothetical protein
MIRFCHLVYEQMAVFCVMGVEGTQPSLNYLSLAYLAIAVKTLLTFCSFLLFRYKRD